jgi:hypothetical protein
MASALAAPETPGTADPRAFETPGTADSRAFAAVFEEQNLTTATIMARLEAARAEGAALREAAASDDDLDDRDDDFYEGDADGAADGARDAAPHDGADVAPSDAAADDVAGSLRRQCAELRAYVALLEGDMEAKRVECARAKAQAAKCVLMMRKAASATVERGIAEGG